MYHPATSPSALLVDGRLPAREPGAAPGASKLANCPSGNRSKPWALLLASKYCPVIDPHGLMLKAAVPSKLPWGGVPLPASGSSNVVKEPSGRRTKPWNTNFESREYPAITPCGLMLAARVPIVVNPAGAGGSI